MKKASRQGQILRVVAEFLEALSDAEIEALLDGRRRLQTSEVPEMHARVPRSARRTIDHAVILASLREARTRQEAALALEVEGVSKVTLESIARHLDLPVLRSDSVERLRQRIVEGTVGFQINSDAIQGKSR